MTSDAFEFACPKCHAAVVRVESPPGYHCGRCHLLYRDVDGIPSFLISEAEPWPSEADRLRSK